MRRRLPPLYLAAVLFLTAAAGFFAGVQWHNSREIPFNAALWKAGSISQTVGGDVEPFRQKMIQDLLRRHLSRGMSKSQVTALLGEPESVEGREMFYWLSEEYGWGIDPV